MPLRIGSIKVFIRLPHSIQDIYSGSKKMNQCHSLISTPRKRFRNRNLELQDRRNSISGLKSASLFKSSSNIKVCRLSSPRPNRRNTSPLSMENQQIQTYQRTIYSNTFNICGAKIVRPLTFEKSLSDSKDEVVLAKNVSGPQYLRSGMVLLKNFLSHNDQAGIVKKCRALGVGCGGFYRPRFKNGAMLRLHMMCLGKDWDPQTCLYGDTRLFDDAVPPEIPEELREKVDNVLHDARAFLIKSAKSVEEVPNMLPDICIVNFYNNSGKLGLHQDKDESEESLKKGLPVVSFSIGDSAEFLYSDRRNVDEAEKVILESGDVLIFGGESRLIYHGVSCIIPKTTPKFLIDETKLRPGRLCLTFRQF